MRGKTVLLFLLAGWLAACAIRTAPPGGRPAAAEEEFEKWHAAAVAEFRKMHWHGWKEAAALCQRALAQREDRAVRQLLFDSQALLTLREWSLRIPFSVSSNSIEECLEKIPTPANRVVALLLGAAWKNPTNLSNSFRIHAVPELAGSAFTLDAGGDYRFYLYILWLEATEKISDSQRAWSEFFTRFPDSNLAFFLRPNAAPETIDQALAAYPDFAELYLRRGERYSQDRKYSSARRDYEQALQWMPALTPAWNGLGSLFYRLDEFDRALSSYDRALEAAPADGVALFGRGVCLNELGRVAEADAVFRQLIEQQPLYHGEAFYYLALNQYNSGNRPGARRDLDIARTFIPDSVEVNMLSGVMRLEQEKWDDAERDFLAVLKQNNGIGDAYYYLGEIDRAQGRLEAAGQRYFDAGECYVRIAENFGQRMAEIAASDLDEELRRRWQEKISGQRLRFRKEASAKLARILGEIAPGLRRDAIEGLQARLAQ